MNRQTNSTLGVLLMLGAMFLFSAVDTKAKYLTDSLHPVQIIWFRQLGLLAGAAMLLASLGVSILHTRQLVLQLSRGVLMIGSALLFVFAIKHVPLADAVAASFVAPFFLTILGALVLQEKIGPRRWAAVAVGFIGVLIIIRPGLGVIHPAVILVIFGAFVYSIRQVIGRLLADTDKTATTVIYTAVISSVLISIPLPFVWQWPDSGGIWGILLAMALLAGIGEVVVIRALEVSEAGMVAPIHYTLIIWGTMYGYLFFGHLPDSWTLLGTAIIVAAGLYMLQQGEKKAMERKAI